jgi:electron transport complex protein RnfB
MRPFGASTGWDAWSEAQAQQARERYAFHQQRVEREALEHEERLAGKARAKLADLAAASHHTDPDILDRKRAVIEAALERARARKSALQRHED